MASFLDMLNQFASPFAHSNLFTSKRASSDPFSPMSIAQAGMQQSQPGDNVARSAAGWERLRNRDLMGAAQGFSPLGPVKPPQQYGPPIPESVLDAQRDRARGGANKPGGKNKGGSGWQNPYAGMTAPTMAGILATGDVDRLVSQQIGAMNKPIKQQIKDRKREQAHELKVLRQLDAANRQESRKVVGQQEKADAAYAARMKGLRSESAGETGEIRSDLSGLSGGYSDSTEAKMESASRAADERIAELQRAEAAYGLDAGKANADSLREMGQIEQARGGDRRRAARSEAGSDIQEFRRAIQANNSQRSALAQALAGDAFNQRMAEFNAALGLTNAQVDAQSQRDELKAAKQQAQQEARMKQMESQQKAYGEYGKSLYELGNTFTKPYKTIEGDEVIDAQNSWTERADVAKLRQQALLMGVPPAMVEQWLRQNAQFAPRPGLQGIFGGLSEALNPSSWGIV